MYNLASQVVSELHWDERLVNNTLHVVCAADLHLVCSLCPPVALFSLDSFRLFTGTGFGTDLPHLMLYPLGLEPGGFLPQGMWNSRYWKLCSG